MHPKIYSVVNEAFSYFPPLGLFFSVPLEHFIYTHVYHFIQGMISHVIILCPMVMNL